MSISDELFENLKRLEESLWVAQTRFDKSAIEQIFAADFFEFGRSGRAHTREACVQAESQQFSAKLPLENFKVRLLASDVAQVTYDSHVSYGSETEHGRRSSIWSLHEGRWVLRFHQGTPFEQHRPNR